MKDLNFFLYIFLHFPDVLNECAIESFCFCCLMIHINIFFKRIKAIQHPATGKFPKADGPGT